MSSTKDYQYERDAKGKYTAVEEPDLGKADGHYAVVHEGNVVRTSKDREEAVQRQANLFGAELKRVRGGKLVDEDDKAR